MTLIVNKYEIENVLKLPALKRYHYFIKRVADTGKVWGLYQDGWALVGDEKDGKFLPIWPSKEYAELCADGEWSAYKSKFISLNYFLRTYIHDLKKEDIFPVIFYNSNDLGIVVKNESLIQDLVTELKKVE